MSSETEDDLVISGGASCSAGPVVAAVAPVPRRGGRLAHGLAGTFLCVLCAISRAAGPGPERAVQIARQTLNIQSMFGC